MKLLASLDDLRHAAETLARDDEICRRVAKRLRIAIDPNSGMTLEQALGLEARQGSRSWRLRAAIDMRNHALRQCAAAFFPDRAGAQIVSALAATVSSYGATAWLRERRTGLPALYPPGSARAWLYEAFRVSGGRVPDSPKQLSRILRSTGHEQPHLVSKGS